MSDGEPPSGPDPQTTTGDELTHIDVHFPDNVRFPVDTHSRTIYDSPRPDFPEWSFKNHQAVADARKELRHYLCEKYGVVTILFCEPFLVLGCDGCLPSPDARPFSVAGQIAIWRDASDMNFIARVGTSGFASAFEGDKNDDGFADDELMVRFPPAIQAKVRPHEVPHRDIILHVASLFPDCSAVTWIWGAFVVELEVRTPEEFTQHLSTLPVGIHGSGFELVFYNGPLPNAAARLRAVKPKPHLDVPRRIAGETNYVKTDGKFYPGSMLCSVTKARETYSAVSAGVPVEKDGEQRLTCSYHNWEDHHKNYPDKLGRDDRSARRIFQVVQGENGTTVGVVGERIGETDIALAELEQGVKFENKFMNLSGSPRLFTRSRDITLVDDFLFDSFTTGRQIVKGDGRVDLLPRDGVIYIAAHQVVCATNNPVQIQRPFIRGSACGAVLVRKKGRDDTVESACQRGEICGMFHYADLQGKNLSAAESYLIFADSFDPLIEAGWSVVVHSVVEV